MLTRDDQRAVRDVGRDTTRDHINGLIEADKLTTESLEFYATGIIEGIVACLARHCGSAAAADAVQSALSTFPYLRRAVRDGMATEYAISPGRGLDTGALGRPIDEAS